MERSFHQDGNAVPATLSSGTYGWHGEVSDANGNMAVTQSQLTVP